MLSLRHRLMLREAERRLGDAKRLAGAAPHDPFSDSAHLLSLLGFELLLKLVVELSVKTSAPKHHNYCKIFAALPQRVRAEVEQRARARVGPSAFESSTDAILKDWETNFTDLRYPYERYSDMTEAEYQKRGENWVAGGGKSSDADFRFHPEALFGFVESLRQEVAQHG